MIHLLLAVLLVAGAESSSNCQSAMASVELLRAERITGSLIAAETGVRQLLECPSLGRDVRLAARIELAKVLDRQGLHNNTRPVLEALEILREAQTTIDSDDARGQASLSLALAAYHYRAEMAERQFEKATLDVRRALALFRELDDPEGETDSVHLLGLIELQKRNLDAARELFEQSLECSRGGEERPIFVSDYHRHVGLVDLLSGNLDAAIPHFEASLAYRNNAGSRDYGIFARTLLGSALTDHGNAEDAIPHLEEALRFALELPSPVGELRASLYLGQAQEALGRKTEALRSYRRARELATSLGVESFRRAAVEGIDRLSK